MKESMTFNEQEKESFYRLLNARRDVRSGFLDKAVPDEVLQKILGAAHEAPSVGFLQPWNFIVIRSQATKQKIKEAYLQAKETEAELFSGERKDLYESLKLEGILEAPLNICVTCDRKRDDSNQLGRSTQGEMDIYSTVCAIQNMWLAARIEDVGMGWVSILDPMQIRKTLDIPESVEIVAYFCLGYVDEFKDSPELETKGWNKRLDLEDLVRYETW